MQISLTVRAEAYPSLTFPTPNPSQPIPVPGRPGGCCESESRRDGREALHRPASCERSQHRGTSCPGTLQLLGSNLFDPFPDIAAPGAAVGIHANINACSAQPSILELEFSGGTPCPLTNSQRGTTVNILCGHSDAIVSIVEDFTCHYKVTITTPTLCKHPAFVQQTPATRSVTCAPAPPGEEEEEEEEMA